MTVTIVKDSEFTFANQDRSLRIAYNSANNQKEILLNISYSDSQATDSNGDIVVDLSLILSDWNKIFSITLVSEQDYENGIIGISYSDTSDVTFRHFNALGTGVTSATSLDTITMADRTYKIWVRGY